MTFSSSHPADAARMNAMLMMLTAMGFTSEANAISAAWSNFETVIATRPSPEYSRCYANAILSQIVDWAWQGVPTTGVKVASAGSMTPTVSLLNDAWAEFWRDPARYASWEAKKVETLRRGSGGTKAA
ncbi:MAG TPA: hypothetical protein VFA39_14140 [Steroidobacteraceae bacterium]|nr:hypothetical protein [Steroidobacteraceae bacterium]